MATEKRLIDANATYELLRSLGSRDYRRDKGTIMDAMKMISHPEYTPTVDAVEVVRGEWKDARIVRAFKGTNMPVVQCSECECYFCDIINNHHFMYHYCPNCGAKMRGSEE